MTGASDPQDLRRSILASRRAMPAADLERVSQLLCQRFLRAAGARGVEWRGRRVALYAPMPGEPDLSALGLELRSRGALLFYPRIVKGEERDLEMAEAAEGDWVEGPYGILEPASRRAAADPGQLDVIFVPGVVFGLSGERLGMGKGYYDRYLIRAPQALRVALVNDFQLLPRLEQQPWDQGMHWIFTESREVTAGGFEERLQRLYSGG